MIPYCELHVHIEGTLEPALMLSLAKRNNVSLPFSSVEEAREKYQFRSLQEFLDMYYAGCAVLQTEDDFYEVNRPYSRCFSLH